MVSISLRFVKLIKPIHETLQLSARLREDGLNFLQTFHEILHPLELIQLVSKKGLFGGKTAYISFFNGKWFKKFLKVFVLKGLAEN